MIRAWKRFACTVAITAVLPVMVATARQAQAKKKTSVPAPTAEQRYTMPSTSTWDITSDEGEVYRIFVSYPKDEAPKEGFPVLYVLDGNAYFAPFAATRWTQEGSDVGKSIVVGVGYPEDQAYNNRRLYDLTGPAPIPPPWRDEFSKMRSGGWDKFLDFLTGKLRTEMGKRYKINLDRQALFGHSLGGLFAVHALFSKPDAFHAIIAASPSLFWHQQEMLKEERDFAAGLQAGQITKVARLMVVAGDREETQLEKWDPESFIKRLEPLSAYGLRLRSEIYMGEGHMTVPVRSVSEGLRFAFGWP